MIRLLAINTSVLAVLLVLAELIFGFWIWGDPLTLRELEFLNIWAPKMTDEWLEHLGGLAKLEELRVFAPKLTDAGANIVRKPRNSWVYLRSRSMIRYRLPRRNPSTMSVRFRAICSMNVLSGFGVIPATCTRRVDSSMKNRM